MFDRLWLDRLSRVHHTVPLFLFMPAIFVLLVIAFRQTQTIAVLAWFAGGWLFWTLTEYWMHRAVFHFEPDQGMGARLHWIIHGVHHDHPNDPMRLVMPPSVSIPLSLVFYLGFVAVFGAPPPVGFWGGLLGGPPGDDKTPHHLRPPQPQTPPRQGPGGR